MFWTHQGVTKKKWLIRAPWRKHKVRRVRMMLQIGLGAPWREIRPVSETGNFYHGMPILVLDATLTEGFQGIPARVGYNSLNGVFVLRRLTLGCRWAVVGAAWNVRPFVLAFA